MCREDDLCHWGLSPTPSRSLCQRVNLELQFIKFLVILPFNFQLSLHLEVKGKNDKELYELEL